MNKLSPERKASLLSKLASASMVTNPRVAAAQAKLLRILKPAQTGPGKWRPQSEKEFKALQALTHLRKKIRAT